MRISVGATHLRFKLLAASAAFLCLFAAGARASTGIEFSTAPPKAELLDVSQSAQIGSALAGALAAAAVQEPQGKERKFTHKLHVSELWMRSREFPNPNEYLRDCRGCHIYESDGAGGEKFVDPQAVCTICHINTDQFRISERAPYKDGLDPLREEGLFGDSFLHIEHDSLTCRECHEPKGESGEEFDYLSSTLYVPRSFGECKRCHDPDSDKGPSAPKDFSLLFGKEPKPESSQDFQKRFLASLNAKESMGSTMVGGFYHDDHLIETDAAWSLDTNQSFEFGGQASDSNCGSCHGPIFESTQADFPRGGINSENCGSCHIQESEVQIRFLTEEAMVESGAWRTFFHRDHLQFGEVEAILNSDRITQESCSVCHVYREERDGQLVSTYDVLPQFMGFKGCVECHAEEKWSASSDHHTRLDRRDWDAKGSRCLTCHEFGQPDIANLRPQATVKRVYAQDFEISVQYHPGIVLESRAQECSECHRAEVSELPSRVEVRAFNHDTHLPSPELVTQKDCDTCHDSNVAQTKRSEDLGVFFYGKRLEEADPRFGLTYNPGACAKCHKGSQPVPNQSFQELKVTSFPHSVHLQGSEFMQMDCTSCHGVSERDIDGDRKIGVLPKAADCSECHEHEGESVAFTGNADRIEVNSCGLCHVADGASELAQRERQIPKVQQPLLASRIDLGSFADAKVAQYHPDDRACDECHAKTERRLIKRGAKTWTTGAEQNSATGKSYLHSNLGYKFGNGDCIQCHWDRKRTAGGQWRGGFPDDQKVRLELGNQLVDDSGNRIYGVSR